MSLRKRAEPVTLVRSPTLTKGISGVSVKGSSPESRISGSLLGHLPRRVLRHRRGDGADVLGRRAAAAADDVDEALAGELLDLRRHELGALVVSGRTRSAGRRSDRRR